ncbi:hypothetical protein CJ030_MR5G000872 [Morella rubra]|uniref:Uncharacterized protein n=1 Tax=Morella rubra TaxID=262757 RepID=A0A6A1VNS3_9ROSI|nr:hypothetical protein CJ030_MR5G000872 [Morella rubra]
MATKSLPETGKGTHPSSGIMITSLFSLRPPGDISGCPSTVEFGSPSLTSSASRRSTSSSNVRTKYSFLAQEGWIQRKEVEEMLAKEREWLRKELGTFKQREESLESHIQKLQMELDNALKEAEVLKGINQQLQDSTTS